MKTFVIKANISCFCSSDRVNWVYFMSFQSFPIILPFLYSVLPWIHFYDSSLTMLPASCASTIPSKSRNEHRVSEVLVQARNPRKDKMKPKFKFKAYDRIRFYFRAPVTKFYYSMVGIQSVLHFCSSIDSYVTLI